ncbi:MAG: hypothetical protein ABIP02_05225 [Arenimonas sp.]
MNTLIDKDLVSRCCWQALVLSSLSIFVFPETFTSTVWLGQTWLWLISTPIFILLILHRHRFAAAWSAALVSSRSRRRRQTVYVRARRKGFGRINARQNPLRAA